MIALGIILLMLCLLFLMALLFRTEIKEWQKERRERRKTVDKIFKQGGTHDR